MAAFWFSSFIKNRAGLSLTLILIHQKSTHYFSPSHQTDAKQLKNLILPASSTVFIFLTPSCHKTTLIVNPGK